MECRSTKRNKVIVHATRALITSGHHQNVDDAPFKCHKYGVRFARSYVAITSDIKKAKKLFEIKGQA